MTESTAQNEQKSTAGVGILVVAFTTEAVAGAAVITPVEEEDSDDHLVIK